MNSKIIFGVIIVIIIFGVFFLIQDREALVDDTEFTLEEAEEIAGAWITSSAPTYVFDGSDLELIDSETVEEGVSYKLTFSFVSSAAGYGDRSDEMLAQVITPHTIEVVVERGEVISAITDGVYNEMENGTEETEDVTEEMTVSLYFLQIIDGQEEVVAVTRQIPATVAVGRASIEELLKGPSPEEKDAGYSTAIPEGTELLSIDIQDGAAIVDFNEKLQAGVAGSAWVTSIRDQIEKTLLQLDTVDGVVIMVNGESKEVLQP